MRTRREHGRLALCGALLALTLAGGCARLPPSQNVLSGRRLIVTMRFNAPVNQFNHYFFLINNAGDQNAPGPVPVLTNPYGNGFAASSNSGANGLTDFIRFDSLQPQGYGLYHVVGDPNQSNFRYEGRPINSVLPDPNDPRTANQLQFEIDLSQLITDANGIPLSDPTQAANLARQIRYLQVNIVATNIIPRDVTTPVEKLVDSLGDTRTQLGASSFLILDVSQNRVISNNDTTIVGSLVHEPSDPDVFGGNDPSLDLVDWSIEVRQQ
jgi:hypothetical protein